MLTLCCRHARSVYLNQLSDEQLKRYTARTGRMLAKYGPDIVDT